MSDDGTTSSFRTRALWQWNPVSCVSPRCYDEKWMMRHNDWFFDRSFMQRYLDRLRDAGLNAWILANTHPFPFMVDLCEFPTAALPKEELARYQAHYHWLFETARGMGIKPFVLFHTCYVPDRFARKHGLRPGHGFVPPPIACDYTRLCVRRLCETYPELAGINAEASENVHPDHRAEFARDAIVAGIHDSGQRPALFFRGWISDPEGMKREVMERYEGECFFTVKYTWEFLIGANPDPEFMRWINTCGAERVLPEFWISNYQPFGCHDTELAAALRDRIAALGCPGFTSHPMDLYGAPFVQGASRNVLQIERDRDWYATLCGTDASDGVSSRSIQRIAAYMTGNKQNFLQPQLLAAVGGERRCAGLQTAAHWAALPEMVDNACGRWMAQIDGTPVRYPGEGGDGFGLADLIAELGALEAEWRQPGDEVEDVRRRDIIAQHLMVRAWTERARAMLTRFEGDGERARPHLQHSVGFVRRVPEVLGFDGPYRLLVGRHTFIVRWSELIAALERELAEWGREDPEDSYAFGVSEYYEDVGQDFA